MSATIELAQTGKRDHLKSFEVIYQKKWRDEKLFETAAPSPEELRGLSKSEIRDKFPKWMGCFPFPYMNGSLHLGHAFSISKIEFAAGYERMLGKRVLFPHGFHVTGMPIKAAADKIVRELELFGQDLENFEEVQRRLEAEAEEQERQRELQAAEPQGAGAPADKVKGKKGKLAAKSTGLTYQFQIMESIGVPRSDIKKFADPLYWLTYFPPIAVQDHNAFGSRIDWRRQFMTTPANPYFDSFVRWQINKLHDLGKIKFGKRYTIYSPKDGQPCMDHDRSEGEALGPQEYTGIKMEVVDWAPAAKEQIEKAAGGRKVYLVAATLRPETMYGQTNCFVGKDLWYGLFHISETEAYVCTRRAARNMAFQGVTDKPGEVEQLTEIIGHKLIGTKIKAPFSQYPEVYVLPMDNVLATKGTGVVTSVPSDSPDDWATYADLRKKPEFYKLDPSWLKNDPVPVLSTPAYGEMTAETLIKEYKIQSQKDVKQLAEAKDKAYKEGFNNGTMSVGEFKGLSVQDAKPKVKQAMIEQGLAFAYAEPEGLIVSRSSDECVVALMDQWYLDYGEPKWRAETERLLEKMELYSTETRNGFEGVLAWLNKWACARTYGLGSILPWDPTFLVESLSDSTIYMAYYTVAQLLHEDSIDGSKPGPLGILPDQMTDEVWDYIMSNGPWPSQAPLPKEKADALKHEFEYFYPFDIRSSGKDLIPNHLTFCLYNHVAIFDEDKWPRSMRTNGHLLLNGEKMSKSKGNSLTLKESVEKFGADATRLSLADAGDGVDDANFDELATSAIIRRVFTLLEWCEIPIHDLVFQQEIDDLINQTQTHYKNMHYKDAVKFGFYELQSARDWYREVTANIGMHIDLVQYWVRVAALVITPIAPHFAEHIWLTILKEPKSIQLALWPTPKEAPSTGYAELSLVKMLSKAKGKKGGNADTLFDPKKPKAVRVYVASTFPDWQNVCVQAVQDSYDEEKDKVDDVKKGLIKDKKAMPFVQIPDILNAMLPYLKKTLNLEDAEVLTVDEARAKEGEPGFSKALIDVSEPGAPAFEYRNV
ncbi:hypothetical protein DL96DRAFT_1666957 [Flagelloscypha sp. PMI_526]|nr:hypothetical protein DL96DRAFT_1666957 [Flagelloscypha sp. PMI_526]